MRGAETDSFVLNNCISQACENSCALYLALIKAPKLAINNYKINISIS